MAKAKVFISYSGRNRDFVDHDVLPAVKRARLDSWYAKKDLKVGSEWAGQVLDGLEDCDRLLVVASKEAVKSDNVKIEVAAAVSRVQFDSKGGKNAILPVMIEERGELGEELSQAPPGDGASEEADRPGVPVDLASIHSYLRAIEKVVVPYNKKASQLVAKSAKRLREEYGLGEEDIESLRRYRDKRKQALGRLDDALRNPDTLKQTKTPVALLQKARRERVVWAAALGALLVPLLLMGIWFLTNWPGEALEGTREAHPVAFTGKPIVERRGRLAHIKVDGKLTVKGSRLTPEEGTVTLHGDDGLFTYEHDVALDAPPRLISFHTDGGDGPAGQAVIAVVPLVPPAETGGRTQDDRTPPRITVRGPDGVLVDPKQLRMPADGRSIRLDIEATDDVGLTAHDHVVIDARDVPPPPVDPQETEIPVITIRGPGGVLEGDGPKPYRIPSGTEVVVFEVEARNPRGGEADETLVVESTPTGGAQPKECPTIMLEADCRSGDQGGSTLTVVGFLSTPAEDLWIDDQHVDGISAFRWKSPRQFEWERPFVTKEMSGRGIVFRMRTEDGREGNATLTPVVCSGRTSLPPLTVACGPPWCEAELPVVCDTSIVVTGHVSDPSAKVTVGPVLAQVASDGSFEATMPLHGRDGVQEIEVRAETPDGRRAKAQGFVMLDCGATRITLRCPPRTGEPLPVGPYRLSGAVAGTGVGRILVNGREATLSGDGTWSAVMNLVPGGNRFTVVAYDTTGERVDAAHCCVDAATAAWRGTPSRAGWDWSRIGRWLVPAAKAALDLHERGRSDQDAQLPPPAEAVPFAEEEIPGGCGGG